MIAAAQPPALTGAGPVYQTGSSAGNDEAAGYQPAASVEHITASTQ